MGIDISREVVKFITPLMDSLTKKSAQEKWKTDEIKEKLPNLDEKTNQDVEKASDKLEDATNALDGTEKNTQTAQQKGMSTYDLLKTQDERMRKKMEEAWA